LLRAYCRRGDGDESIAPPAASTPTATVTMAPRFLQRALTRTRSFRVFPIRFRTNSHQLQENKDPPTYDEVILHPDVYPILKDNQPGSSNMQLELLMDTSPPGGCDAPPSYRAAMEHLRQQNGASLGLPPERRRVSFSDQQQPTERRSARRWSEAGWNVAAATLWRPQGFSPTGRINS
ncbi:unnamed protein product, partial [Meganyctiphanes norvegica]